MAIYCVISSKKKNQGKLWDIKELKGQMMGNAMSTWFGAW